LDLRDWKGWWAVLRSEQCDGSCADEYQQKDDDGLVQAAAFDVTFALIACALIAILTSRSHATQENHVAT